MTNLGATPDDWGHFDFVLGLGANLLPCVPASPNVKVLEGSALTGKVGKIPSHVQRARRGARAARLAEARDRAERAG